MCINNINNINREDFEFDILGFRIKFKPIEGESGDFAREVASFVKKEAKLIREEYPKLNINKIAILLALKMAHEKMSLDREYRENINKLESSASDVLKIVQDISSPVTNS